MGKEIPREKEEEKGRVSSEKHRTSIDKKEKKPKKEKKEKNGENPGATQKNELELRETHSNHPDFINLERDHGHRNFPKKHLETLYLRFQREDNEQTGSIDKKQFCSLLGIKNGHFADKLFETFDDDNDGKISVHEFIINLSPLHEKASNEEKLEFAAKLYQVDHKDMSKEEMGKLLQEDMEHNNVKLDESHLGKIVDELYEDFADDQGRVSIERLMEGTNMDPSTISLKMRSSLSDVLKDENQVSRSAQQVYEKGKKHLEGEESRRRRLYYKVKRSILLNPLTFIWGAIYLIVNLLLFPAGLWTISSEELRVFSWGIILAKCFRMMLYFNVFVIFLVMCRQTCAWLRQFKLLFNIFPFDAYIDFHRTIGWVILFCALGHTIGHYKDFHVIANTSLVEINQILKTSLDSPRSWGRMLFGTISGITGHIMLLCILIMYTMTFLRRKKFEAFWYTHQLWAVFILCLLIHGAGKLITTPIFYIVFAVPGLLFLFEMIFRFVKAKHTTRVVVAESLADKVTLLRLEKPKRFDPEPGQWVSINCRKIAKFEWHPFTLTSAPHEPFLEVHMKAVGAWTTKLYEEVKRRQDKEKAQKRIAEGKESTIKTEEEMQGRDRTSTEKSQENEDLERAKGGISFLKFNVDGPFGAPAQNVDHYETVILFAAGIGVTPFAAVLKHMLHLMKSEKSYKVKKVYFYWSARSQKNFSWFTDIIKEVEEYNVENPGTFTVNLYFTGANKEEDIRSIMLQSVLNYHYSRKKECLVTGGRSRVHFSRPPLDKILAKVGEENKSDKKVGVFFCGPPPLARALSHECHKHRNKQKFKFHKENF